MAEVAEHVPQLHIFYDGVTSHINLNEPGIDVGVLSNDTQVRQAVADYLGKPVAKFQAFRVERNRETGDLDLIPPAGFGVKLR